MPMAETSRKKTSSMLWRTIGILSCIDPHKFTILMTNQLKDIFYFFLFSNILDVEGFVSNMDVQSGIRN